VIESNAKNFDFIKRIFEQYPQHGYSTFRSKF